MPERVMVDLETMGTGANSAIIAIGAVVFENYKVTDEFYRVVDLQSCIDAGLEMDASTVMWWMQQSDEARAQFNKSSNTLQEVLEDFSVWCPDNAQMWGNGAAFDNVILSNAYKKCGMTQPWKFWNDMCYRTLKNMNPKIKMERVGTYHNALDDAKSQALHLMKIFQNGY